MFDDVASRTNVNPAETNNVITELANIDGGLDPDGGENLTDTQKALIRRNIDLVQNFPPPMATAPVNGADISGDLTRTRGRPSTSWRATAIKTSRPVGMQIKSALDDGFQASASPADQAALTQILRYQWRLMKTRAAAGGESAGAPTLIDPGEFASRVVAASRKLDGSTGGIAYTGDGTIGELGKIAGVYSRSGPRLSGGTIICDEGHASSITLGGLGSLAGQFILSSRPRVACPCRSAENNSPGHTNRSGFNLAQSVLNNALYRPSLLGETITGRSPAASPLQSAAARRRLRTRHGRL